MKVFLILKGFEKMSSLISPQISASKGIGRKTDGYTNMGSKLLPINKKISRGVK